MVNHAIHTLGGGDLYLGAITTGSTFVQELSFAQTSVKLSMGRVMMPCGSDAIAQHEADYQQRYKVDHVAGPKGQLSLFIT
jgi:hypothetical protein